MIRIPHLTVICLLLLAGFSWSRDEFPDPRGYVSDFAEILSPQDEVRMTAIIAELKEKTTAEMAVVTMPDIGGQSEEIYANRLFAAWGIGVKGKDNGILLLVALQERRFRIETGYGLEGILPDGLLGQIADERIIPHLREDRYAEGLLAGTLAIAQIIAQDAGVALSIQGDLPIPIQTEPRSSQGFNRTLMLFLFFFIFASISPLVLLIILARRHGGLYKGGSYAGGFGSFGGGGSSGFGGFSGGFSGGGGVSRGF